MSQSHTIEAPVVDVNVPRFNQGVVALFTAAAFVLQRPSLVAIAFVLLLASRVGGARYGPLTQLYVRVIRPRLQPDGPSEFEDARPPAFSQGIGVAVTGTAVAAFVIGLPSVGWILTVVVATLATLAAAARICVGCILYERFIA